MAYNNIKIDNVNTEKDIHQYVLEVARRILNSTRGPNMRLESEIDKRHTERGHE